MRKASDIHFEPYEDVYRIRLRCDGILVKLTALRDHLSRRLAARIKILSKLDVAERRLPQDGRIKLRLNRDTAVDMRVHHCQLYGERRLYYVCLIAAQPILASINSAMTKCKNSTI